MINKQRLTDSFKALAAFDSESFYEKEIADYLYKNLIDLGLEVVRDEAGRIIRNNEKATGNIYGILKGDTEGEPVLFAAHMDTVAPGIGKKVIIHEDGRVTSDGTTVLGSDDITGIAAILEMLEVIKENQLPHPDIEVAFFVAEEPYCIGSSVFDYSVIKSKKAYVLDLDGPVGRIANAAPSIIQFEIKIEGKSAHAGFEPEKGISSITAASKAIERLKLGRIDESTTANIGKIIGGSGKNVVPGVTYVEGEVRSLDNSKALSVIRNIKETFENAAKEMGAHVTFESKEMVRAYKVEVESQTVKAYTAALASLGYGEPEIITTFGGSDNNNFCMHGIEGIVISNAMNAVHTTNEYFYIDDFVKSTEIIIKLATF